MSSMIPQPPPSIQIGGGGPPQAGDKPSPIGSGNDPDAQNVTELLRKAMELVTQAATAEKDDIDANAIHKIAVAISGQIAAEQKLNDDVMGAGPGVKMIRKTAPAAGGSGGGGY